MSAIVPPRMLRAATLATLLFATVGPAVASAQDAPSASVMAVAGTIGLDAAAWIEAADAIEARLREAGFRIDDSGLPRRDDCTSVECLREERATRNVDVLVTITIFAAEGGDGAPGSVVVAMVDADGRYVGEERVDGRVIGVVAALALAAARQERERGPEPWVRVSGTPPGAIVRIDGREVGVVPYEGRVAPGEHEIEVTLGGHEPLSRHFTARAGSTENVEVALPAIARGGSGAGGALIGTGVALVVAGLASFIVGGVIDGMEGSCTMTAGPRCIEGLSQTDSDTAFYVGGGIGMGVGAGLIIVGITLGE